MQIFSKRLHGHFCVIAIGCAAFGLTFTATSAEPGRDAKEEAAGGWTTHSPYDAIRPKFSHEKQGGRKGGAGWTISTSDSVGQHGWYAKSFPVTGGQFYQFSSWRSTQGVGLPRRSAIVRIVWQDADGKSVRADVPAGHENEIGPIPLAEPEHPLDQETDEAGWTHVAGVFRAPSKATQAVVELHLQWAPRGRVAWSDVTLNKTSAPASRKVRLATIHYVPSGKSAMGNCEEYAPLIAKAAEQKADLVVLGETVPYVRRGKKAHETAESIPGPTSEYFGQLARTHQLHIVVSLYESERDVVYNTAILVGPDGKLIGKYRKVCLPHSEVEAGVAPGDEYPVFQTKFGKVGMMICYDGFFPEVARELTNRGAEVIAWPVWGCNPMLGQARACENHVFVVSSTYTSADNQWMISAVFDHAGHAVAQAKAWGDVVVAEVDLGQPHFWRNNLGDFRSMAQRHRPAPTPEGNLDAHATIARAKGDDALRTAGAGGVTTPPPEVKAPPFYSKYISAGGYPIVASKTVNDYALREAAFLVDKMLTHRPDVRKALIDSGSRMCIIAHNEFTTDLPEFAKLRAPAGYRQLSDKDYWDARARGTGGSQYDPYCSCGEENLLSYPGDPYATECILIHEFAHSIHLRGMAKIDRTFDERLKKTYDAAMLAGLWKGKYASVNHHEYFAEGVQSWFDDNRENDNDHNHVNTREELLAYDPGLAAMCREVFGDEKWSYTKAVNRLTGHLEGYDAEKSPRFVWPERLTNASAEIRRQAQQRGRKADEPPASSAAVDGFQSRTIQGWTVLVSNELLKNDKDRTEQALQMTEQQLKDIQRVVPAAAVAQLRQVKLWFSPEYADSSPKAEYHPDAGWLRKHGRKVEMARGIEFTNVRIFEAEVRRMPVFVLHELAHAYHHQVFGFDDRDIVGAYERAKSGGKYDHVEQRFGDGRSKTGKAYAMSNPQEYFAESSEAFFGTNDFYPFTRAELEKHDPDMMKLLTRLWRVTVESE